MVLNYQFHLTIISLNLNNRLILIFANSQKLFYILYRKHAFLNITVINKKYKTMKYRYIYIIGPKTLKILFLMYLN